MPRQSGFQLENNFTRGLITEATGLNFPENACTETFDCVFSEKGRATRRLGFDYEGGHVMERVNKTDSAIVEYLWTAAGGSGDRDIVVVQVGSTLFYYEAVEDDSLSGAMYSFTTNLLDFEVGVATDVKGNACQFASGNGFLFVVHPLCEPFYVELNLTATAITESQITIQCRDLDGDKDDPQYNLIDTRPTTEDNHHKYNLFNQGWYFVAKTGNGFTSPDAIGYFETYQHWENGRADYPSNADIWWLFKDSLGNYNLDWVDQGTTGNSPAPKGHYILNEFDTNRVVLSGVSGATERTSEGKRPSTVAFFTSRIWYAGVGAQEYNQKIYYSQIIDSTEQFGRCYQANDPTSSEVADLLPTDGGVIIIPDVGTIIKLFPMSTGILVFSTNGIWSVSGSEGIGFKATDYSIKKVSSIESLSPLSFVDVNGTPIWWNRDGIYAVQGGSLEGEAVASLSDDTIKQFFVNIPAGSKTYAKATFNPRTRIVQWLYRSSDPTDIEESYTYDRLLNFNILSKAFYPWTIGVSATSPTVHGLIAVKGILAETQETLVVDNLAVQVVDTNGEEVIINALTDVSASVSFRYLSMTNFDATNWDMTWSQTKNGEYLDWIIEDEELDYDSYFLTGYKVHGDAIRFFENNYLTITMSTESNASCFFQGVWDYANSPSGARFTNPQQVYINRTLRDVQQTRKKVRGRGRSLQFKFYSETGLPFTIHGWSAWETQNASI